MKIPIGNTNNISREGERGEKQLDYDDWDERNASAHGPRRAAGKIGALGVVGGESRLREPPYMMSASEGGGRSRISGHSMGHCVNVIVLTSSKCGQGGMGSKNMKFLQMSLMEAP